MLPKPLTVPLPITKPGVPVGRNQTCPCGSGKKFKRCCSTMYKGLRIAPEDSEKLNPPPPKQDNGPFIRTEDGTVGVVWGGEEK